MANKFGGVENIHTPAQFTSRHRVFCLYRVDFHGKSPQESTPSGVVGNHRDWCVLTPIASRVLLISFWSFIAPDVNAGFSNPTDVSTMWRVFSLLVALIAVGLGEPSLDPNDPVSIQLYRNGSVRLANIDSLPDSEEMQRQRILQRER